MLITHERADSVKVGIFLINQGCGAAVRSNQTNQVPLFSESTDSKAFPVTENLIPLLARYPKNVQGKSVLHCRSADLRGLSL